MPGDQVAAIGVLLVLAIPAKSIVDDNITGQLQDASRRLDIPLTLAMVKVCDHENKRGWCAT